MLLETSLSFRSISSDHFTCIREADAIEGRVRYRQVRGRLERKYIIMTVGGAGGSSGRFYNLTAFNNMQMAVHRSEVCVVCGLGEDKCEEEV